MSKSCNKIPPDIKSRVLSELQVPGCIVSRLGKKYNVSNTTIHTWQRQTQKIGIDDDSASWSPPKTGGYGLIIRDTRRL
jgi:transposase